MQIKYTSDDERVDVQLIGELDTPATVDIQGKVDKLLALCSKNIVIDCEGLRYIASSGLRQLITIHKQCKADGGHMTLVNVKEDVMEIFSVTRFDKVFDIQ